MKTTNLLTKTMIATVAIAATACMSTENDGYIVTSSIPNCYNQVIDNSGDNVATYLYDGVSYTVEYNYTSSTATVVLNGLSTPDGQKYPSLSFSDVPYTQNNGWKVIDLTGKAPEGSAGFVQAPTFNKFSFNVLDRYIGQGSLYAPLFDISYKFGDYTFHSLPQQLLEYPATTITCDGQTYTPDPNTDQAIYLITCDVTTRKATIAIQGAKFHKDMPALNMSFKGVPFVVDDKGVVTMAIDSLVPNLLTGSGANQTETPAPGFPITDLKVVYTPAGGTTINFVCTPTGKDGQPMGVYDVSAVSTYPKMQ